MKNKFVALTSCSIFWFLGCSPGAPKTDTQVFVNSIVDDGEGVSKNKNIKGEGASSNTEITAYEVVDLVEKTTLVFKQGRAHGLEGSEQEFKQVALAQAIIEVNSLEVKEGAKFLVFEQADLDRLYFQSLNEDGKWNGDYTILADKKTHKLINGYLGWHMGPPESK
ncbi:MAG: hypothetical protein LBF16_01510 [Pseudomonadales bacterium]|jgi:hypothetical protein|nr:hypothetical protein [Pseudomonadales bacterium]